MARTEFELIIKAPLEKVYQVSQDYSVRYEWDAFPEKISLLNSTTTIEKGVRVSVKAKNGLAMDVEFVQVKPPTTAAIKMIKGPMILSSFSGSWVFKFVSENETQAKFVYAIRTKWWSIPFYPKGLLAGIFQKL